MPPPYILQRHVFQQACLARAIVADDVSVSAFQVLGHPSFPKIHPAPSNAFSRFVPKMYPV